MIWGDLFLEDWGILRMRDVCGKEFLSGARNLSSLGAVFTLSNLWGGWSITGYYSQNCFIYTRFRNGFVLCTHVLGVDISLAYIARCSRFNHKSYFTIYVHLVTFGILFTDKLSRVKYKYDDKRHSILASNWFKCYLAVTPNACCAHFRRFNSHRYGRLRLASRICWLLRRQRHYWLHYTWLCIRYLIDISRCEHIAYSGSACL